MTAPLPEVRQCQDPEHNLYGAVAVQSLGRWGVMDPAIGGHWATDAEVDGWKTLT